MKSMVLSAIILVSACACQSRSQFSRQSQPRSTETWTALNKPDAPILSRSHTLNNKVGPVVVKKTLAADKIEPQQVSVRQAVEQFIPPDYRVDIDDQLNLDAMIQLAPLSAPRSNWLEALSQGMAEADIDFITNLNKKIIFLRVKKVTLSEVIEKLIPNDFTVFSDADVNLQTLIYFDTRLNWVQALHGATAASGIDFTINFSNKIISLKPHVSAYPNRQNAVAVNP